MGAKQNKLISPKEEIICPQCPLTPIINLFLNEDNKLTCEFRCPNMHFGHIPFIELFKYKNVHGNKCHWCEKNSESSDKNVINEELLYCGVCKEFMCNKCRPLHDKEKESHKILVKKSKVNYTCLEHNKNFIGFCFSCLSNICPECKRHEKHSIKNFKEFYSMKSFMTDYDYHLGNYKRYLNSFKRKIHLNKVLYDKFLERNEELIVFAKYLLDHFNYKKSSNKLNSEILINLLNVVSFDFQVANDILENKDKFEKYCKTHLILNTKPISYICTFSKNKQDININNMQLIPFCSINSETKPDLFRYSPKFELVIFSTSPYINIFSTNKNPNPNSKGDNLNTKITYIYCEKEIYSFNILNKNILCICSQKLHLYKLASNEPYYIEDDKLPSIENKPGSIILEILGNFEKFLITRTNDNKINLLKNEENKEKFEIIFSTNYISDKNGKVSIKNIFEDYLICLNKETIKIRDITKPDLNVIKDLKVFEAKNKRKDLLVYNSHILICKDSSIEFYTIPNLVKVSELKLLETINSINIVSPKAMIVVENQYIEQLEVNTWKRLWRTISLGFKVNFENIYPIGAGKKLFLYNKENNKFYLVIPKSDDQ